MPPWRRVPAKPRGSIWFFQMHRDKDAVVPELNRVRRQGVIDQYPANFTWCIIAASMEMKDAGIGKYRVGPPIRIFRRRFRVIAAGMYSGMERVNDIFVNSEFVGDHSVMASDTFDRQWRSREIDNPTLGHLGHNNAVDRNGRRIIGFTSGRRKIPGQRHGTRQFGCRKGQRDAKRESADGNFAQTLPLAVGRAAGNARAQGTSDVYCLRIQ